MDQEFTSGFFSLCKLLRFFLPVGLFLRSFWTDAMLCVICWWFAALTKVFRMFLFSFLCHAVVVTD